MEDTFTNGSKNIFSEDILKHQETILEGKYY